MPIAGIPHISFIPNNPFSNFYTYKLTKTSTKQITTCTITFLEWRITSLDPTPIIKQFIVIVIT